MLARLEKAVWADVVWRLLPRESALEYFKKAIFSEQEPYTEEDEAHSDMVTGEQEGSR